MNKIEVKEILGLLAAVDNRKIEPETVEAWFEVIGGFSYVQAREAVVECRKDPSIMWVEPKHVYARAKALKDRQAQYQEQVSRHEENKQGEPCPECKHGRSLIACDFCCKAAAKLADIHVGQPYPKCRHSRIIIECGECATEIVSKVLH